MIVRKYADGSYQFPNMIRQSARPKQEGRTELRTGARGGELRMARHGRGLHAVGTLMDKNAGEPFLDKNSNETTTNALRV